MIGVDRTYLSSNIRKGIIWSNTQQYANPKVDELLAQAAAIETSPEKRKALYSEFPEDRRLGCSDLLYQCGALSLGFAKGLDALPTTIWGVTSPLDELYWETPTEDLRRCRRENTHDAVRVDLVGSWRTL